MYWWGDGWDVGHWIGFGFNTLFWIALIVGIVYLIRHAASRSKASGQDQSYGGDQPQASGDGATRTSEGAGGDALSILKERYARGEIDRDEFLQRKSDLTS